MVIVFSLYEWMVCINRVQQHLPDADALFCLDRPTVNGQTVFGRYAGTCLKACFLSALSAHLESAAVLCSCSYENGIVGLCK